MVVIRELPCNLAGSARVKISHSGSEGPGGLVLWGWGCPCFPGRVPGWGRGTARGGLRTARPLPGGEHSLWG